MGRCLPWRFVVTKILLLSQLLIVATPLVAEEAKDKDKDQKVRIASEDPFLDGFFLKRWAAFTKEEQEAEDIAFLFFAVVGGGFGVAAVKSIFSSAPAGALAERRKFKNELIEKLDQKKIWEKHEHEVVKNYIESRKAVEALRRRLEQTQKSSERSAIQRQLREAEIHLSKAAGNLEQSPNECVKLLSYIAKLDEIDEKLVASLYQLHKAASSLNEPHARELKKAIHEWEKGQGLYAIEDWLRHSKSQPLLNNKDVKEALSRFHAVQEEASELVKLAIPFYNDVAQKRNLRIRQTQSRWRQLPMLKRSYLARRWYQEKKQELPLYNYRKTETGHDTRNFDETDSHHQPNGNSVSRARLANAAKDQCALGYEQLTNEVKILETKSSLAYTFRNQETLLGVTALGAFGMWASNEVSKWNSGKTIIVARTEGINAGKRVDAVSNDLSAQMTADDLPNGPRLIAPLYDGTTNALLKQMPRIADQIEKNIQSLGGMEGAAKKEALDKLKGLLANKDTIRETVRNSVKLSAFQIVSEQRIGDIQRFAEIIRAKEEGTLVTATSEQVNLVIDATLRKFFSTVSSDVLQLLDNDGTIDTIRAEVLEHLKTTNRGTAIAPDTSLPIQSLPGVRVEAPAPKTSVKAEPLHIPTAVPATNIEVKNERASLIDEGPTGALTAIQSSLTMGEPVVGSIMGPTLIPPMTGD